MTESVESAYYAFMGFDADNARRALQFYTQFFPSGPVLELACGPGVFLSLLRSNDVEASGVDIDDGMVETARQAGHNVVLDDALAHLKTLPDRSLHGVFAAHFLEHLPAPQVQKVYEEAYRVLEPGCAFVAAVPNAACLSVLGYDFWRDPTHVRFYDPIALQFFARQAGFVIASSGGNPFNHPGPPPGIAPMQSEQIPSLRDSIMSAVQRASTIYPPVASDGGEDEAENAEARLWGDIGNVLSHLDDRVQSLQHDLHTLRSAYGQLVRQLYPANEVYVAATVPVDPSDAAAAPALQIKVEGTA